MVVAAVWRVAVVWGCWCALVGGMRGCANAIRRIPEDARRYTSGASVVCACVCVCVCEGPCVCVCSTPALNRLLTGDTTPAALAPCQLAAVASSLSRSYLSSVAATQCTGQCTGCALCTDTGCAPVRRSPLSPSPRPHTIPKSPLSCVMAGECVQLNSHSSNYVQFRLKLAARVGCPCSELLCRSARPRPRQFPPGPPRPRLVHAHAHSQSVKCGSAHVLRRCQQQYLHGSTVPTASGALARRRLRRSGAARTHAHVALVETRVERRTSLHLAKSLTYGRSSLRALSLPTGAGPSTRLCCRSSSGESSFRRSRTPRTTPAT